MDEGTGVAVQIKAMLVGALPPGTGNDPSSVEELLERIARKRRRRQSALATVAALAVVLALLVFVLLPFGMSEQRGSSSLGPGPASSSGALTSVELPGPYTAYAAARGPLALSPNGRTAYIGDAHKGIVTLVDIESGRSGRPIRLGPWPVAAIAVTPNGRTAYVVEGGVADAVVPINLATGRLGPAIRVPGPRGLGTSIIITPDGHMAYVDSLSESETQPTSAGTATITHTIPSYVVPIDLETSKARPPISLDALSTGGHIVRTEEPPCLTNCAFGETIGGIAVTPDGDTAYVSDGEGAQSGVVPIDLATDQVGPEIVTGGTAGPVLLSPDAHSAYVGGNGTITPIDLRTKVTNPPIHVPVEEVFDAMAMTPDGATLVADGYPEIAVINLSQGTTEHLVENPTGGRGIAVTPTTPPSHSGRSQRALSACEALRSSRKPSMPRPTPLITPLEFDFNGIRLLPPPRTRAKVSARAAWRSAHGMDRDGTYRIVLAEWSSRIPLGGTSATSHRLVWVILGRHVVSVASLGNPCHFESAMWPVDAMTGLPYGQFRYPPSAVSGPAG
jgi:DNA-binding beta-propeller fold protein YncE